MGNPTPVPFAGGADGQTIAGVRVNPLIRSTQNDALASMLAQQQAQRQILADALEAERLRLARPKFDNVIGGVQSTEDLPGNPLVAPAATGDTGFFDSIGRGLGQYVPGTLETLSGLGGFIADKVGADDVAGSLMQTAADYRKISTDLSRTGDRFSEAIKPEGSIAQFAGHSIGNVLGSVLESIAVAGASAAAGAAGAGGPVGAGAGAIAGLFGKSLVKKEIREQVENWVEKETAERIAGGATREVAEAAVTAEAKRKLNQEAGKVVLPLTGLFAAASTRGAGEVVNQARAAGVDLSDIDVSDVATGGAVYGLMETFADKVLLRAFGAPAALPAGVKPSNVLVRVAKKGGTTGITEGLTEVGQDTATGVASGTGAPSGLDALDAFMAGFAGGGAVGGAGGVRRPGTQPAVVPPAAEEPAAVEEEPAAPTEPPASTTVPRGVDSLDPVERGQIGQRATAAIAAVNRELKKQGIMEFDPETGQPTEIGMQADLVGFLRDPALTLETITGAGLEGPAAQKLSDLVQEIETKSNVREAELEMRHALTPELVQQLRTLSNRDLERWAEAAGGLRQDAEGDVQRWNAVDLLRLMAAEGPSSAAITDPAVQAQVQRGFAAVDRPGVQRNLFAAPAQPRPSIAQQAAAEELAVARAGALPPQTPAESRGLAPATVRDPNDLFAAPPGQINDLFGEPASVGAGEQTFPGTAPRTDLSPLPTNPLVTGPTLGGAVPGVRDLFQAYGRFFGRISLTNPTYNARLRERYEAGNLEVVRQYLQSVAAGGGKSSQEAAVELARLDSLLSRLSQGEMQDITENELIRRGRIEAGRDELREGQPPPKSEAAPAAAEGRRVDRLETRDSSTRTAKPGELLRTDRATDFIFDLSSSDNPVTQRLLGIMSTLGFNPQVEIYLGNIPGEDSSVPGLFDYDADKIQIAARAVGMGEQTVHVMTHELTHGLTGHALYFREFGAETIPPETQRAVIMLEELYAEAKKRLPPGGYWRKSVAEFVSEAWSNKAFQRRLAATPVMPGNTRSLYDVFRDAIRWLLGGDAVANNMLDLVLDTSEKIMADSRAAQRRGEQLGTQSDQMQDDRTPEARARAVSNTPPKAPPKGETPIQRVIRERIERNAAPETPRDRTTSSYKADDKAHDDALKELSARPIYEGTYKKDGRIVRGRAYPELTGGYTVVIDNQPTQHAEDAQAARTLLSQAGITPKSRSVTPYTTNSRKLAGATLEQQASVPIRHFGNIVRRAVSLVADAHVAEELTQQFYEAMATGAANFMSRFTWIDQLEAGIRSLGGDPGRLGRSFRNALQRTRSLGTRAGSPFTRGRREIAQFLRDMGLDEADLGEFLGARHAPEANAKGRGVKKPGTDHVTGDNPSGYEWTAPDGKTYYGDEAATKYMQSLSPDKAQALNAAAAVYDRLRQETLALQLQFGLLTQETYDNLGGLTNGKRKEGAFEHWVPYLTEGQETRSLGPRIGRSTKAWNPYVNGLRELQRMQRSAVMNTAWQRMYAALLEHPDPDYATLDGEVGKPKGDELAWQRADNSGENSATVWIQGRRHRITFKNKQAIDFLKRSRADEKKVFLDTVGRMTRILAGFRTAWNAAFIVQATAWDALMLASSIQSSSGGTLDKEAASDVTKRAFGHLLSSLKTITQTTATGRATDPYYIAYERDGGGIAFGDQTGISETLDIVRSEVGFDPLVRPWSATKKAVGTVVDMLHAPEAMFRFSAFKAYIEHKAGKEFTSAEELKQWGIENNNEYEQALEMSRLITADFSDTGLASGPRSLFMFFNASMQGTRSLARLPQSERGRQAITVMVMAGAAAALIGAGDEDDEDVDGGSKYARLKGRGRQAQFGEGFAIPLAPEMRMAYVFGNVLALMGMGKMSTVEGAGEFARSAVDTILPLRIPETDLPSESMLFMAAPSFTHPFITALAGVDGFGRETETPEDRTFTYDETGKRVRIVDPANYERGRDRDPEWAKDLARGIHDEMGIDLYPGRIAEVARSIFGGTQAFIANVDEGGIPSALTKGYKTEYDQFHVINEYDEVTDEARQELRRMESTQNALEANPRREALQRLVAADKSLKNVRVNGFDENALYKMQRQANATGDEAQIEAVESLMTQLRGEKARIMGAALADARALGDAP